MVVYIVQLHDHKDTNKGKIINVWDNPEKALKQVSDYNTTTAYQDDSYYKMYTVEVKS